ASTSELTSTLKTARRKGFPIRVAMIAHDYDLGSAGLLYKKPQTYSKFLAQELAQFNAEWVLIVMPNGYGIYHCVAKQRDGYKDPCESGRPATVDEQLLATLPPVEKSGADYAAASNAAVQKVAELHGVKLGGGGGGGAVVKVVGAVFVVLVVCAAGWAFG